MRVRLSNSVVSKTVHLAVVIWLLVAAGSLPLAQGASTTTTSSSLPCTSADSPKGPKGSACTTTLPPSTPATANQPPCEPKVSQAVTQLQLSSPVVATENTSIPPSTTSSTTTSTVTRVAVTSTTTTTSATRMNPLNHAATTTLNDKSSAGSHPTVDTTSTSSPPTQSTVETTTTTLPLPATYRLQVSSQPELALAKLDHFVVCVGASSGQFHQLESIPTSGNLAQPISLSFKSSETPSKVRVIAWSKSEILAVGNWQSQSFPWMFVALSSFLVIALLVVLTIFLIRRSNRQYVPLFADASLLFAPTPPPPPARRVEEVEVALPDRLAEITEQRRKHLKNVLTLGLSVSAPANAPVATKTGLAWVVEVQSEVVGLALWSEKVAGKGEDALPSLMIHKSGKRGFLAVYDGLGGAGAAPASLLDGSPITNAFESSRISRELTENWAAPVVDALKVRPGNLDSLNESLYEELVRRGSEIAETGRGLSSSLKRTLPTTVAAISFDRSKDAGKIRAIWAGDSRAYLLTPTGGLQQLTIDDTRAADALEALVDDPPIENLVCADRDVELNTHTVGTSGPFVAFVATDGCFGYWPSPPIFEYEVLKALVEASSYSGWAAALQKSINEVARDDTSLSLVSAGYQSFSHLRSQFLARYSFLADTVFTPFAELHAAGSDRAAFEEYRSSSWAAYKATYERIGPRRPEAE